MLTLSDLKPYQKEALQHLERHPHAGIFLDMGLGKTVISLTFLQGLLNDLVISKPLIIAPKRVAESVWSAEIENWEHLQGLTISKIIGSEKQRISALQAKTDLYIIGRDNLVWLVEYFGSKFPFDTLIIDESSSFKNHASKRFKALKQVRAYISRAIILTGTPAPNTLLELWPQIYILDKGQRLGKFITRYREEYFTPGRRNGAIIYDYKLKSGADKLIHDKISDICISMKAEDYLSLPGVTYNDIFIDFPEPLKNKYLEFEAEQVMKVKDTEIAALQAATLSNKLLQFANGAIYDEEHTAHPIHELKIEVVKEIIDCNPGKPVLIAWAYRHDRDRLLKALAEYKPQELKDDKTIRDWNAGKIPILLTHPASGGHGLNLQFGGHIIVWFGQTWSLELYQQLNKRLDRPGQTQKVIIHRLIARGTMDEEVIKAQNRKEKGQDALMRAINILMKKHNK